MSDHKIIQFNAKREMSNQQISNIIQSVQMLQNLSPMDLLHPIPYSYMHMCKMKYKEWIDLNIQYDMFAGVWKWKPSMWIKVGYSANDCDLLFS